MAFSKFARCKPAPPAPPGPVCHRPRPIPGSKVEIGLKLDVGRYDAVFRRLRTLLPAGPHRVTVSPAGIAVDGLHAGDVARIRAAFPGLEPVLVPDEPAIVSAERNGEAPLDAAPDSPGMKALVALAESLLV